MAPCSLLPSTHLACAIFVQHVDVGHNVEFLEVANRLPSVGWKLDKA